MPLGIVPFALLFVSMPAKFPHLNPYYAPPESNSKSLLNIDFLCATFLFAFGVFLVSEFQEANTKYPWSSAVVIVLFILSNVSVVGFLAWEKYLSLGKTSHDAVFPWRMMKHCVFMVTIM